MGMRYRAAAAVVVVVVQVGMVHTPPPSTDTHLYTHTHTRTRVTRTPDTDGIRRASTGSRGGGRGGHDVCGEEGKEGFWGGRGTRVFSPVTCCVSPSFPPLNVRPSLLAHTSPCRRLLFETVRNEHSLQTGRRQKEPRNNSNNKPPGNCSRSNTRNRHHRFGFALGSSGFFSPARLVPASLLPSSSC